MFWKMHGNLQSRMSFPTIAEEKLCENQTQQRIERYIENVWRAGDRWSRKY